MGTARSGAILIRSHRRSKGRLLPLPASDLSRYPDSVWRSAAVLRSGRQSFPYNQDSLGSTPRTREAVSLSPYRLRLRRILIDLTTISTVDFPALLSLCFSPSAALPNSKGAAAQQQLLEGGGFQLHAFPTLPLSPNF